MAPSRAPAPSPRLAAPEARTVLDVTPASYRRAVSAADTGDLSRASDIVSAIMRDGRAGGVLEQRTAGMLALPSRVEPDPGDPLTDWPRVFPEAEQARLLAWGIVLGVGFARVETSWDPMRGWCREITTWDARWFRHDSTGWHVQTSQGSRPVRAGEGWIVYAPFGLCEPWRYGLWHRLAVPLLAKLYAVDDRSRAGEVTPLLVGKTTGLSEAQRRRFLSDLQGLARDSRVVLPEGCTLEIVDRSGSAQHTIHEDTIAWADREMAVAITGQIVTTEGAAGFSAGGAQKAILHSILRAQEATWSTCIGEQALTPWLRLSRGYDGPPVYPRWDVSDPEVLTSKAYAAGQLATALAPIDAALSADGLRVDVRTLIESAGLPTQALPAVTAERPSVALAPTDAVTIITVDEARAALGLSPLPDGAGGVTVASYRAAAEAVAAPAVDAPPAAPPPDAAAAVADEELSGADASEAVQGPDETIAAFAARMTELAIRACSHGRSNKCVLCGIERVRDVAIGEDGEPVFAVAWRPIASASAPRTLSTYPAHRVAASLVGDEPPTRFLLFRWGPNESDKGDAVLTREGVERIMRTVGSRELMVDLEHRSLDRESRSYDPDARGWFTLGAGEEGLWAENVRWTADGERRLREKLQRYTSPAFDVDADGTIVRIVNVALTALPATTWIAPLIAASVTTRGTPMDDTTLLTTLRMILGLPPEATNDEIAAAAMAMAKGEAAPAPAPEVEAPEVEEASATPRTLSAALGTATDAEARAKIVALTAAAEHARTLSTRLAALEAEKVARDRADILREHGAKFDARLRTWAQTQTPEALRAFVAVAPDLTSERVSPPSVAVTTAAGVTLSALDADLCAKLGTDPKIVAAIRAKETNR